MGRGYGLKTERVLWVDVLRFLGMTLIFWGHLAPSDPVTLFIFAHHVPLFFFISGFFAGLEPSEGSVFRFLWKKIRSLVFPYIIFTILFYIVELVFGKLAWADVPQALLVSACGIRNQVPGPLWFFTCLFVVAAAFEVIKRLVAALFGSGKSGKAVAFICAVILFAVGILFLGHEPAQDPQWIWNVDSAFVYVFYYALGSLVFPSARKWNFRHQKASGKVRFLILFVLSLGFAVFTLLKGTWLTETLRAVLGGWNLKGLPVGDALFEIYAMVSALILIFFDLCIARFLGAVPGIGRFLGFVGKDSLYHCGNELIIKFFGGMAIAALGLDSFFAHDLTKLLYSVICLIVLTFTLNLAERLAFGRLFGNGRLTFGKGRRQG